MLVVLGGIYKSLDVEYFNFSNNLSIEKDLPDGTNINKKLMAM